MSKDDVKKMFSKIEKDAGFQKNYFRIIQEHQKEAENFMADRLIEFGKISGFSFTKDDLMAARAELVDKFNSNMELAEKDLASVAGGLGPQKNNAIVKSLYSFGVVCAINSLVEWNKCSAWMTTSDPNCKKT